MKKSAIVGLLANRVTRKVAQTGFACMEKNRGLSEYQLELPIEEAIQCFLEEKIREGGDG